MYLKKCEVFVCADLVEGDIRETIEHQKDIIGWAYILHDKDDTRPHYHICLDFGNSAVDSAQVAEWFGVSESCVDRICGRFGDVLLYLTHCGDGQKKQTRYSPSEVVTNLSYKAEIGNARAG